MRKPLVVLFVFAAIVAGVAGAWAAIPSSPGGVFTGCVSTAAATKGALRVIDAQAGAKCTATEQTITWNQRGINWRGTWASGTAYAVNDAVAYQGSSYIATAASTAVVPTTAAKWGVLAQKGTGVAAPKLTFFSTTSQSTFGNGSGQYLVIQEPVPAGKQLVTWHATVVDFGPTNTSDFFRCFLYTVVGGNHGAAVGEAAAWLNSAPGQGVQTISNQAVIDPTSTQASVALVCSHDNNLPNGTYYVDPGATLSAFPTS